MSAETPEGRIRDALLIAENYANAPCITALLGEELDGPCTCVACAHRAVIRALKGES